MNQAITVLTYTIKRLADIKEGESIDSVLAELAMARKALEAVPCYGVEAYVISGIVDSMFTTTDIKEETENA